MITSKNNALIKELAALKEKKYRDERGEYLVEGFKMVKEAFDLKKEVVCLVGTEKGLSELGISFENTVTVTDDVLARVSDCKTPQGVVCVLKQERYSNEKPGETSILLDRVSDPGNMGTIIRTAAATGVKDIYLIECCDPFSPKVVRASMSGIYSVKIHFIGYKDICETFSNVTLIVGDMGGENLFDYTPKGEFCIAAGNEANGVSEELKKAADKILSIPMTKNIESLNVGVALSVMTYQLKFGGTKTNE